MAHPFEKQLLKALAKSTSEDNVVLQEAEKLRDKGYPPQEISGLLRDLKTGLIDPVEAEIASEAFDSFNEDLV